MPIPPNRNTGDAGHVNDHNDIAAQLLASPPIGSVMAYAANTAPTGYLLCQGQNVSRTTYAALFAVIGTTYGVGNGSTTFGLPNLKGRIPVGLDSAQTEFDQLNESGGTKTHTLTTSEIPAHSHTQNSHDHGTGTYQSTYPSSSIGESAGMYHRTNAGDIARGDNTNNNGAWVSALVATGRSGGTTATNQNTGGGGAHNNLQPYLVLQYIIRAE